MDMSEAPKGPSEPTPTQSVAEPYHPPVGSKWRMTTDVTVLDVSDDELVTFVMNGSHYRWFLSVFLSVFSPRTGE